MADEYQTTQPELSEEALASLHAYHFPGNVRELQNILERAMTLCENDVIRIEDLALTGSSEFVPVESPVDEPLSEPIDSDADQDTDGQEVTVSQDVLPEDGESLDSYLEDIEKNVIVKALEATRWNKTAAAKKLGITFRALRYKLKKLDLE
jgi:two-component system response regulator PilR (NtrC family)